MLVVVVAVFVVVVVVVVVVFVVVVVVVADIFNLKIILGFIKTKLSSPLQFFSRMEFDIAAKDGGW